MRTIILGVILMAALKQEPVDTTMTYVLSGPEKKDLKVTYKSPKKGQLFRMGYDALPKQLRNVPFWLPPELRKVDKVVYDDGEGFKHDKGKMEYRVRSEGTWKKFSTLIVTYVYQGMQQFDNWAIEAHYDKDSGFLVWADTGTRMGSEDFKQTFELTVSSSSDEGLNGKLK